jgi:hypothetical protein
MQPILYVGTFYELVQQLRDQQAEDHIEAQAELTRPEAVE